MTNQIIEKKEPLMSIAPQTNLPCEIWKYQLPSLQVGWIEIEMPTGSEPLVVQWQDDIVVMWVYVHPDNEKIKFKIYCAWTGQPIPSGLKHLCTVQERAGLVWHLMLEE